jgi:hypothetical protein
MAWHAPNTGLSRHDVVVPDRLVGTLFFVSLYIIVVACLFYDEEENRTRMLVLLLFSLAA